MDRGQRVSTPFGNGTISGFRDIDSVYEIQLPFGTIYCKDSSITKEAQDMESAPTEFTNTGPDPISAEDMNVMYESLEKMRRLNLELACEERGIPFDENCLLQCSQCLLESPPLSKSKREPADEEDLDDATSDQFP